MLKKIIIGFSIFLLISCSSNSNTNNCSSTESNFSSDQLPPSNGNDVGGDHLQSDWEWDK